MDSLTQIVLGAATGEVVLGKKIGNRAMVWGAVGGTIPDLDVMGKFFLSNIDNVAFHRGISHSITFSVIGAVLFGWMVYHIYQSPYHKWIASFFKALAAILVIAALNFVFKRVAMGSIIPTMIAGAGIGAFLFANIKKSYFRDQWEAPPATLRDWQWLFFWSLFTHPILDCFTMYGTELFAPFSNARIAWATVSVADPLYTVPFIICLLIAARQAKTSRKRRIWNYLGIGLSSCYLLFTVFNKQRINQVFAAALAKDNIEVERMVTNSAILNNIVWSCTAETPKHFYVAQYSLFDEVPIEFSKVEKRHELVRNIDTDPTLTTLNRFTKGFFTISKKEGQLQLNDLRFGTFSGKGDQPDDFIFRFKLVDEGEKGYRLLGTQGGPPEGQEEAIMGNLWKRIKGIKKPK